MCCVCVYTLYSEIRHYCKQIYRIRHLSIVSPQRLNIHKKYIYRLIFTYSYNLMLTVYVMSEQYRILTGGYIRNTDLFYLHVDILLEYTDKVLKKLSEYNTIKGEVKMMKYSFGIFAAVDTTKNLFYRNQHIILKILIGCMI